LEAELDVLRCIVEGLVVGVVGGEVGNLCVQASDLSVLFVDTCSQSLVLVRKVNDLTCLVRDGSLLGSDLSFLVRVGSRKGSDLSTLIVNGGLQRRNVRIIAIKRRVLLADHYTKSDAKNDDYDDEDHDENVLAL